MRLADRIARTPRPATLTGSLLAACMVLGACTVNVGTAPSSPNFFYARLTQDGITGTYDPTGFSSAEVEKAISQICATRRVTRYAEQPAADGRIGFYGYCRGGSEVLMGTTTFNRIGNRLRIEVPGYAEKHRKGDQVWSISL
ncbi:hypothetical protein FNJ84_01765 [Paracoccus sp. M683]|uniref:hypothetical protein n=1 Tax=Paracoccus sp. M683 TaxID=2594268 RepID=UPI0011803612|nr:hypothetical protein [Paracoccus sp. M683]TRW99426.1 hypothetical protein FNJ84_01765 [Paracoccus sp. M683]